MTRRFAWNNGVGASPHLATFAAPTYITHLIRFHLHHPRDTVPLTQSRGFFPTNSNVAPLPSAFGHDRVAVLDGGMPAWREHVKDKPHLLDTRAATPEDSFASLRAAVEAKGGPAPAFQAKLDPRRVRDLTQVMAIHRDHVRGGLGVAGGALLACVPVHAMQPCRPAMVPHPA